MNIKNLEVWREIVSKIAPPEDHERLLSQGSIVRQVGELDWAIDRCGEYPDAPLVKLLTDHLARDGDWSNDVVYVLLRAIARSKTIPDDEKPFILDGALFFGDTGMRASALHALADVGTDWARESVQWAAETLVDGVLKREAKELLEHWEAK